jgi:hypothetical protein
MKGNSTMNKVFLFLSIFIVITLACDLAVTVASPTEPVPMLTNTLPPDLGIPTQILASATSIPTTEIPVPTTAASTSQPPSVDGVSVTYGPLGFDLPSGIAGGFVGNQFPRAEGDNVAPWEVTPGHTRITLDGYLLQGKFHQPQIFVYPATEYALMYPAAFESIHRLNNILYSPDAPNLSEPLPGVPFFNAAQIFASNVQAISFQGGSGVRFVTQYAQNAMPVNNHELFYHFQGLSRNGAYYIIAIFPVTAPVLAESNDPGAVLPPGGIPYPDIINTDVGTQGYYVSVTDLLNATSPDAFTPSLNQLDALIQSMLIAP